MRFISSAFTCLIVSVYPCRVYVDHNCGNQGLCYHPNHWSEIEGNNNGHCYHLIMVMEEGEGDGGAKSSSVHHPLCSFYFTFDPLKSEEIF